MKKVLFALTFIIGLNSYGQSTVMLAMALEDGKEDAYLKMEKNWQILNEAAVDKGIITQWSVWKRTPREGDEGWAEYFVMIRRNAAQEKLNVDWEELSYTVFKGKSKKSIDKICYVNDRKDRKKCNFTCF